MIRVPLCLALAGYVLAAVLLTARPATSQTLATYRGGELTYQEFRSWRHSRGLPADPADLREQLEKLAVIQVLAGRTLARPDGGGPRLRFQLAELEDRLLVQELRRTLDEKTQVSDAAVAELLAADPTWRERPQRVKLRNLTQRFPKDASEAERQAIRERMTALRQELAAGADFAALAERESDSESRYRGGRIGLVSPGQLAPELEKVAFGLAPGEVSPVLEVPGGLVLLRCDGVVPAQTLPLEQAREEARESLRRSAAEQSWTTLRKELLRAAAPVYQLEAVHETSDDAVVVRFAGGALTVAELAWVLERAIDRPLARELPDERLRQVLEDHVVQALAAQRARELSLTASEGFQERLRWRRLELASAEAVRLEVEKRFVRPGEAELRTFFNAHPERFVHLAAYHVAGIRWELSPATIRQQFQQAEEVLARIRAGEVVFSEKARDLGWYTRRQLAAFGPEVFRTVLGLTPGQTSEPVRQDDGLWILQLVDFRPDRPMTFAEAVPTLARVVGRERVQEIEAGIEKEVRQELELRLVAAAPK